MEWFLERSANAMIFFAVTKFLGIICDVLKEFQPCSN